MWYASFLLRLWSESSGPEADWHAEVEHIQSGERWTLDGLDELLEFLQQQMDHLASLAAGGEPSPKQEGDHLR